MSVRDLAEDKINRAVAKAEEANVRDAIKGGLGLRSRPRGAGSRHRPSVIQIDRDMIDRDYVPEVADGRVFIDFDLLQRLKDIDYEDFGVWTCRDYVDSLHYDPKMGYGVTVFVEPCGNVTKWSKSWSEAADWWIAVFRSQPIDVYYTTAGWHIYYKFLMIDGDVGFDKDPASIWDGIGE